MALPVGHRGPRAFRSDANPETHERKFHAACAWMRGKGIALDATRAGYYERTLAEIADYHERGTVDDLIARRRVLSSHQRVERVYRIC